MSRNLPSAMATELDTNDIQAGLLIAVTKPDGTVVRSSTFGRYSVTYGGNSYTGAIGFDFSSLTLSNGDTHPAIDGFSAAGDASDFTFDEVQGGALSGVDVQVFLYMPEVDEAWQLGSKFYNGQTGLDDTGKLDLDIKSKSARNQQLVLKQYGPSCQWDVGDAGCAVNMASFTDSVTVVTNPDLLTLTVSGSSRANDFYALGAIKFTSGAMQGRSFPVRKWILSSGTVHLAEPLGANVANGDTATIHAGCDKSTGSAGCGRFSNFLNRLAWAHMPDDNLTRPQKTTIEPIPATNSEPVDNTGIWGNSSSGNVWSGF